MSLSVVVIISSIIALDVVALKKRNGKIFAEVFSIPQTVVMCFALVLAGAFILSDYQWDVLPGVCSVIVLPVYIIRRRRFLLKEQKEVVAEGIEHPFAKNKPQEYLSDAYGICLAWFFILITISLLIEGAGEAIPFLSSEFNQMIISSAASSAILWVMVYFASQKFSSQGFWTNVDMRYKGISALKYFWIPAVAGISFAVASAYIITSRKVQPETPLNEIMKAADSSEAILGFLVLALVIAPLFEEVVFRGYLYRVIRNVKGERFTIIFISLLFAFMHVGQYWTDWTAIFMVALLGFVITGIRYWSGTILSGVVMHYFYNGGVTIFTAVLLMLANPSFFDYQLNMHQYSNEKKIELLKTSIEADPELAEAYNDLAWIYAEENIKLDEALVLAERALSLAGDNEAMLDTKAAVLEKLGRFDEAASIRNQLEDSNTD